jgi:uncharacterized iron-regulated protein
LLALIALAARALPVAAAVERCAAPATWTHPTPGGAAALPSQHALAELARRPVVLLGENHENPEHHRWQLHTIAALHAQAPQLVLGFEMFPRSVQAVLDDWTAGRLTEAQLLERTRWAEVWGYDAQLYLPIFHFARMHRVPMVALNVDRGLVRRVGEEGWETVPADSREGVGDPAPPSAEYQSLLYESYLEHLPPAQRPQHSPTAEDLREPAFVRFVQSMQVWDRAMAEAIAQRARRDRYATVVAIMGSGHLRGGYGVPHQLRALGVSNAAVALPWETDQECDELQVSAADLVFGVAPYAQAVTDRPRLGVRLEDGDRGVVVQEVVQDSVAQASGVRVGDVLKMVAGRPVQQSADVIAAVRRQAPGTWLPLTVQRSGESLELVARFPPAP